MPLGAPHLAGLQSPAGLIWWAEADRDCSQGLAWPWFTHSTMEIPWFVLSVRGSPPWACFLPCSLGKALPVARPSASPALSRNTRSWLTLTTQCSRSLFSLHRHPSGLSQARLKTEHPQITKQSRSHIFFLCYFPTPTPTGSLEQRQTSWSHWH